MSPRRKGRIARWLVGPRARLPRGVRLAFHGVVLGASAGAYALTGSEAVQLLVLYAVIFGGLPLLGRFGTRDEYSRVAEERNPPFPVLGASLVFAAGWGVLVFGFAPALDPAGPWFLFWLVMAPWLEVYVALAERNLRREGTARWKRSRPLRDSALAGAATAPLIFGLVLLEDLPATEAIVAGVACGSIVFAMSAFFASMSKRAQASDDAALASPDRSPHG